MACLVRWDIWQRPMKNAEERTRWGLSRPFPHFPSPHRASNVIEQLPLRSQVCKHSWLWMTLGSVALWGVTWNRLSANFSNSFLLSRKKAHSLHSNQQILKTAMPSPWCCSRPVPSVYFQTSGWLGFFRENRWLRGAWMLQFRKMPGSDEEESGHELNTQEEQRGGPVCQRELAQM